MHKLLLVIFVAVGSITVINCQNTFIISEKLNWSVVKSSNRSDLQETEIATFDKAVFDPVYHSQLRYVKKIPLPSYGAVNAKIIVESTGLWSGKQLQITQNSIPPIQIDIVEERNQFFAFLSFIPVVNNNGVNRVIEEFNLEVQFNPRYRNTYRNPDYKTSSVLKDGDIYKIAIEQTGIHKMDIGFLTASLGISLQQLTTDRIKIYGSRGGLLPEPIIEPRIDDLEEMPYVIIGGEDGSFDQNDYILFYAEGADLFKLHNGERKFEKNIYDFFNYYFIKIDNSPRKVIESLEPGVRQSQPISTRIDRQRYEIDKTNLLGAYGSAQGSGKDWYGDIFSVTRSRDYEDQFNFNDIVQGSAIGAEIRFVGRSSSSHNVIFTLGDKVITESVSSVNTSNIEARYAREVVLKTSFNYTDPKPNIAINYPSNGDNEGWLDYIDLIIEKNITYSGKPLSIINESSIENSNNTYQVSNVVSPIIWDVTDPLNIKGITGIPNGNSLEFHVNNDYSLREYMVFEEEDITKVPEAIGRISNQDLHSIQEAELVIIYNSAFKDAAERLREHRVSQGLEVVSVDIATVFNEFSSGKKDPVAIRDFSRMVYSRSGNYKYLLLFGDGSYDYKNLVPGLPDNNFLPAYETNESLHPIEAFPSDDFFALLSDFEGEDLKGQLEIAVGRIPVKTAEEANVVVDKIVRYETDPKAYGDWRLKIGFTADDEDSNTHLNQAERIAKDTEKKFELFNQQKVYFDAFKQESTPGGARYPDASKTLNDNLFKGQLVLNYLGHGGPKGWAQERVLKVNDILGWRNFYKMPLIITATCSFTGYDDPGLVSAGEYAILSDKGGAIALMTTVRAVYSLENERLTASVFDTIFSSENGTNLTIGEIIQRAKNNNWQDTSRINARKFALIGDPSMRLSIPEYNIVTTHINGNPVLGTKDTIRALQKINISGVITDKSGNKMDNFSGIIYPTVYDKKSRLVTLKNDSRSRVQDFELHKSILFKGAATIKDGEFSFDFIVPKDIDYRFGSGRISYYGLESGNKSDAAGSYNSLTVGGTDTTVITDAAGPDISLFMNDENFVFGGVTTPDPILLVKLFDENGINVTGNSIGHDLVAILDGDNKNSYLLNEFYESEVDNFKNGMVRFPLDDLSPGPHTISVKAWDIANNSSESLLEFNVVSSDEEPIKKLYNYPNPFSTQTEFMFEHTLGGGALGVNIFVYSLSGKLVKTIHEEVLSEGFRVNQIFWDGKDDFGDKLGKGIYLYKIKVMDREFNVSKESDFQKLVIIH